MANFNIQITNRGKALQAKAQAGIPLVFTRMRIGSGSLSGQQIADMTALIEPKLWLSINKSVASSSGKYTVGAYLSSDNVTTGFYFREWGIFAQDPDLGEILYSYGNVGAGAEYIAAGGGSDTVEKQLDAITIIGNASNVSAVLDESLVFPSRKEFDEHREAEVLDHPDGSVTTAKLADGAANDDKIGNRTIDDTAALTSNSGRLTSLLSGLANMIKSITGGASWRTAPGMTIAAIKTILDAATNAATANALIKRDANGRAKVAAPSATDDIARKAEVDAAITTAASDATSKANAAQSAAISAAAADATSKVNAAKDAAISTAAADATAKANAVQSNLNTHSNDTTKHITAAERTAWNAKADKNGTLQTNLNADLLDGVHASANATSSTVAVRDSGGRITTNGVLSYAGSPSGGASHYSLYSTSIRFGIGLSGVESGNLSGADFVIWNYNDNGSFISEAFKIRRINSDAIFFNDASARTLISRAATGTAPLVVASTTQVNNLNADLLDGQHGSYYAPKAYASNMIAPAGTSADPNTTEEAYIVSNHANCPISGRFYHIHTYFYSSLETGSKGQLALQYNNGTEVYYRNCYNNVWSSWDKLASVNSPTFTGTATFGAITSNGIVSGKGSMNVNQTAGSSSAIMQFFGTPNNTTTRSAWMGYGSNGTTQFTLINDIGNLSLASGNGSVHLIPGNGGSVFSVTPATVDESTKVATTAHTWAAIRNYVNATAIPSNANLNSYTAEGEYYTPNSAVSNSLANNPAGNNSINLTVKKTAAGWITQELTTLTCAQYIRYFNADNGTWGVWHRTGNFSPAFYDTPTAPTAAVTVSNDQLATTKHVTDKLNAKVPMKIYNSLTTPVGASSGDLWFPPA